MFKNLLVLLIALCVATSTLAADPADAHSGAHMKGPEAAKKFLAHKKHELLSKVKPVNKETVERANKVTKKMLKKSKRVPFDLKVVKREGLSHEHVRNQAKSVDMKIEGLATTSSSSSKALNKVLAQSSIYYGSTCDETYLYQAGGDISNACLMETNSYTSDWGYTYDLNSYTNSVLKVTTDGVSYGTMISSYFTDNNCQYPESGATDISESMLLDSCFSYAIDGDSSTYSMKVSASNTIPSGAEGVIAYEFQGARACNANDMNGLKSYVFQRSGACTDEGDGTSMIPFCSFGSPYFAYYSDSTCTTFDYSSELLLNCDGSKFRYECISA